METGKLKNVRGNRNNFHQKPASRGEMRAVEKKKRGSRFNAKTRVNIAQLALSGCV